MGNNELLLAISDMMDQKLDGVHLRMDRMEERLDAKIDALDAKIDALDAKIDAVDEKHMAEIRKTTLIIENVVVPRIMHIEQCYLDASERYIKETGRINGLVADVSVIKNVVQDHSVKLKKIS